MHHTLNIKVSRERQSGGIMACHRLTVRERLLRFFLGCPVKLTVIVPGDSVDEVAIFEKGKEGAYAGTTAL
ncbi:hypothetical protein BCS37_06330 [Selenomonas sp. oral taxon 920]|uniref:hypothetical protein n=1 Tax=Selenomonas sp. oral taxon 920 TaxID=1884263 RepID=UPI000840B8E8|nr:hypothetical protein [Selenomonas sp. oral taxon 920]AOH48073.1 hypothetical protein BCS37_06330 [Selenomonas sp. oral taxon 920]